MTLVVLGVLGRLLVWVLQTSGPTRRFWSLHPFLTELGLCDFCVGCWVFSLLAWPLRVNLLSPIYVPILSEIATGITFSFVSHLVAIGWRAKWGLEVLGDDE
jgi:hypothetical protein